MNKLQTITEAELAQMLTEVKGTTYASVLYYVGESKSRTVNKQKLVNKLTFAQVTLGSNYARKVNKIMTTKQGAEDSDFVPQSMNGRTVIHPCVVQSNKSGQLGMYGIIENHNLKHVRRKLVFNDLLYSRKALENLHFELVEKGEKGIFTDSYFEPTTTKGQGQIKPENDFGIVTPHLSNIRKIKMYGQVYKVLH